MAAAGSMLTVKPEPARYFFAAEVTDRSTVISLIVVLKVFDMVLGGSDSRWEDAVLGYEAGEGAVLECEDNYQHVHPVALNFNLCRG
jgi:hypothetical protein